MDTQVIKGESMTFYPQFCYNCGLSFVSKARHVKCYTCHSTQTINCFRENYNYKRIIEASDGTDRKVAV